MKLGLPLTAAIAASILLLITGAKADVKLPAIFNDHMVLQQEVAVPVWGWAASGEKVTVEFAGQTASTQADADGKWMVRLSSLTANPHSAEFVVRGANTITVTDVIVGEVWFASGQSNMEMKVKAAQNAETEIAAANYSDLRFFQPAAANADEPLSDTEGKWVECMPATVGDFSAAAYFFARDLDTALQQPVGIVSSSVGGSMVEWWTSQPALAATPEAKPILDFWNEKIADWPARKPKYDAMMEVYRKGVAAAKENHTPEPKPPRGEAYKPGSLFQPANLFNGMVAPVIPYAIRGAFWYQGESNRDRPNQYRALLPAMIRDWRARWGQGDFPFLIVQLPNYQERKPEPAESPLALQREAQAFAAAHTPKALMIETIDIGDAASIHPKNKQDVGHRLSLAALSQVYGKGGEWSGPLMESTKVEGSGIRVKFSHAEGLAAKDSPLRGFAIAGEDRRFVWADAQIDHDSVLLSAPAVPKPVAVRYAWADNPECNLVNAAGLPAAPFRSDNWHARPVFQSMAPDRNKPAQMRVVFADVGEEGFVWQPVEGFMVAGEDKVFHQAKTEWLGTALLVFSEQVLKPVAVRYAWADSPLAGRGTLRAVTGLELLPFRTDEWSDATYQP